MNTNVGEIAGLIWNYLENDGNKPVSLTTLAKGIKLKKEEVSLGVGWLAREDKMGFEKGKISTKVFLNK